MGGRSTPFTTPRPGTCHAQALRRGIIEAVKTTGYFERSVMSRPDRKGIRREWCESVLDEPERTEVESNGRVRHWAYVAEAGKYLRVVTLEDGETVHNAMFDRSYARRRRKDK